MELDIRTLAFVATLSSFLMAVSLSSLWWVNREEKATFHWMAGAFLMALGFLLIGLRHQIGPFWSVVVANLSILTGYYLQYTGVCVFLNKAINRPISLALFAVVGVGFVYYTFVSPDVGMRIVFISWSVALITLLAAMLLGAEIRRRFSVPEALTALFFILYALFMGARGGIRPFRRGNSRLYDRGGRPRHIPDPYHGALDHLVDWLLGDGHGSFEPSADCGD